MMRTYDNGAGFTVSYSLADAEDFAQRWPGSSVNGSGAFGFDDAGNLLDMDSGSAVGTFGADWAAFAKDCQEYGAARIEALRQRHARKGGA